jgi:hypothetical protein
MLASRPFSGSIMLVMGMLLLFPSLLLSQQELQQIRQIDTIDTFLDVFDETTPLYITMTLDLKMYQREKYKGEYMPVSLHYQLNDTLAQDRTMQIKARGNFRKSHCNLAPFWLNLRGTDKGDENDQNIKGIKIVTHCKGSKSYEEYVLKEYLCYKIYNIITPVSFRVRLVRMTYIDTGRKNQVTEGWAFMIEPQEMLAARNDAILVKNDDLPMRLMRPLDLDVMALFQYMIGHVDYSIAGRHNVKILGLPGFGARGYTPVPYDFDYSGFVNTYYAIPDENIDIKSVRERYYLGLCRDEETFLTAIEQINQHKEEILQLIQDFEYLDPKNREDALHYIGEYFHLSAAHQALISSLERTCI